ncbi:flagellar brake protein [Paludibacterium purpuratum]|uniref:Flagellar brake protein YcgR n=1 Tax=Paludibacterium purpuratum TaxID=1144873 RepID=A0A4R7B780_9NEIS|nr:flagellar brake protein [Paludibacterium purpuratum]TDR80600.1 c-di-GMP-binding flagellar brake protein YcgR [Paludibacterium purpuratum]
MSQENQSSALGASQTLDLTKYTLASPVEIVHHLKAIAKSGYMVTVFSNKGKTFILTRLLEVDAKKQSMIFDWGSDEATNQQLLASERNVFVCSPEGVKTQFITGQVRQVDFEGKPAFEVDLPVQIIKLQRREFFRIRTPVGNPLLCTFTDYPGAPIDLAVFDISLGGLALWLPDLAMAGFDIGTQYLDCHVDLKPFGHLQCMLEVRHRLPLQMRNGQDAVRIGCTFIKLPTQMENLIQRYVGQLERERRAMMR